MPRSPIPLAFSSDNRFSACRVEALVLISPTIIQPAEVSIASAPEDMAKRLFAHPENAQDLPFVDRAIVAKELAFMPKRALDLARGRQTWPHPAVASLYHR